MRQGEKVDLLDKFQWGFDVATSVAIVGSSTAFLIDQVRKRRLAERRKLHDSARSVVDSLIDMSERLSKIFLSEVVASSQGILNLSRGTIEERIRRIEKNSQLAERPQELLEALRLASDRFSDEVYSSRYQLFPLLDTIEGGELIRDEEFAFSKPLERLMRSVS